MAGVQVRGERKRDEILRTALDSFRDGGFRGTNVDQIAAAAHCSKRTVYAHFGDKEGLFRAVFSSTIAPMQERLQHELDLRHGEDPRATLWQVCVSLARIVVTPEVARLRRLIIAEAERFPDLAAEWERLGPRQTVERLAVFLADLVPLEDPIRAAEQVLWLSVSPGLNHLMFEPSGTTVDPGELAATAEAAADLCWRAWARPMPE